MLLATTIDYNDNAAVYPGPEEYYPLEKYEEDLKTLAENGIGKVYLRVNCSGYSNHPSKVVPVFGSDRSTSCWGTPHYARRLAESIKRYDCCEETIRIAHKYGMEAWAWESLYDDAGICWDVSKIPPEWMEIYKRTGGWCGIDPFYLDNMDALAARDPFRIPSPEKTVSAHRQVREKGIGKIVFVNHPEWTGILQAPKLTKDNLQIYISDDNQSFRLYDKEFSFLADQTEDGRNRIVLSALDIHSPYLKLLCTDREKAPDYTMVLRKPEGQGELYDTEGAPIQSGWAVNQGFIESTPVDFRCVRGNAAWDCADCYLACAAGPADLTPYLYGFAEFNVPKAMEHKVARFEELTHYGFDGFQFNTRSHSAVNFPEQYGFNPEVLEKFEKRHGYKYTGSQEDIERVFQIRGEGVAEFFKRCKALTGGRPLFMSAPMPLKYKGHPAYNTSFGPMPWLYEKFFADGSIDGVIMIGKNFENGVDYSDYFTPEITGGRKITIGIFREMFGRPAGYDLAADLEALRKSGLDEVELYESAMLTGNPQCFPFLRGDAEPGAKMEWTYHI